MWMSGHGIFRIRFLASLPKPPPLSDPLCATSLPFHASKISRVVRLKEENK
jgi:hypothetical protein